MSMSEEVKKQFLKMKKKSIERQSYELIFDPRGTFFKTNQMKGYEVTIIDLSHLFSPIEKTLCLECSKRDKSLLPLIIKTES